MNKASLTNLTNAELSRLDPDQTPGVYETVFDRFIAIQDLCAAQAEDKELWLSHHPMLSKALRELHHIITGEQHASF